MHIKPVFSVLATLILVLAFSSDAQNVARGLIIGKDDNRLTLEEYGKKHGLSEEQVRAKFWATGRLICAGHVDATAQLTLKNNIITTAAHAFFKEPEYGCTQPVDLTSCVFRTSFEDVPRDFPVKRLIASGDSCPGANAGTDWAIAELDSSVTGITPYSVLTPEKAARVDLVGSTVTQPSGFHADRCSSTSCPLLVTECRLRDLISSDTPSYRMDCSEGAGASGGAMLIPHGDSYVVLSLFVRFDPYAKNYQPYSKDSSYSESVPLQGEFLNELMKLY
jgi:hypothetical protein